jgi:ribosomal peptide maturation radical SAM protein 1
MSVQLQLICMPFQAVSIAPLSLALLSSVVKQHGAAVSEAYVHFKFAEIFGTENYHKVALADTRTGLLGELLFAEDYRGTAEEDSLDLLLTKHFGNYEQRRQKLSEFKRYCLEVIDDADASLIGFTTSFNQLLPSLWLAQAIKQSRPQAKVVFGGSACSAPMGEHIKNAYSEVDYVVSGDGEMPLLDLVLHRTPHAETGVLTDTAGLDLNELPFPDYDAYVEQLDKLSRPRNHNILAFESSRGCWWGEKSHCTFCGLNGPQMKYRPKKSDRVLEEIRFLWERYQYNLGATDNIMSREHLHDLLPRLAAFESKPILFYEIKANMRNEDVQLLRAANVLHIQPGIESLNTELLRLMRKGTKAIQNLALLKWCREEGIKVSWNLLCGVPGEKIENYTEQLELIQKIPHFNPPHGTSEIRLDRYSPYFKWYEQYGWEGVRPLEDYYHLHRGKDDEQIRGMAYHFDGVGGPLQIKSYYGEVERAVALWMKRFAAGDGLYWDDAVGLLVIEDGDPSVYEKCPAIETIIQNTNSITGMKALLSTPGVEESTVLEMIDQGILYQEDGQVINLAARVTM